MTPSEGVYGGKKQVLTEGILSVSTSVVSLDVTYNEYVELTCKGPSNAYFRVDGTAPTAGVAGNADQITPGQVRLVYYGNTKTIKFICSSGESATVFYRIYS